jgi:hypothetical protein
VNSGRVYDLGQIAKVYVGLGLESSASEGGRTTTCGKTSSFRKTPLILAVSDRTSCSGFRFLRCGLAFTPAFSSFIVASLDFCFFRRIKGGVVPYAPASSTVGMELMSRSFRRESGRRPRPGESGFTGDEKRFRFEFLGRSLLDLEASGRIARDDHCERRVEVVGASGAGVSGSAVAAGS